ncbi:IS3 family transposase [Streptomyces zaomyceticus]|uniref:IS3 family transposase n=1 Tax=Streptomyces zaomyceticus TaxID=68286 RepID=UPI00325413EC
MIRFRFVDEHRNTHKVKRMCDVLGWDRSGYYTWHQNKEARQEKAGAEEDLARRIQAIHTDSRGSYGALRITRKLRDQGYVVNRKRVARIMREREIAGITRRKSRSLTRQDRTAPPAPDLILRDFTAPMPGLKFVGDITCLPTAEGWLYLATVIDLCTREVVGWSMADHMRTELVADAIRMAHEGGHTAGNAIFHSDRRVAIHLRSRISIDLGTCKSNRVPGRVIFQAHVCGNAADHPARVRRYPSDMTDAEWAAGVRADWFGCPGGPSGNDGYGDCRRPRVG